MVWLKSFHPWGYILPIKDELIYFLDIRGRRVNGTICSPEMACGREGCSPGARPALTFAGPGAREELKAHTPYVHLFESCTPSQ